MAWICIYIDEQYVNEYYEQGWSVRLIKTYNTYGKESGCFLAFRETD